MNSISGNKTERDNKVSKEVEDDFRAMNPVEVGDEKRLYYDVPIPALPNFVPTPPTTAFTTEAEFTAERERLLTLLNTSTERRAVIQEEIKAVEDEINNKAYDNPSGFTSTIPPYDAKAKRELLKSYTETYTEPVDPGDTRKKQLIFNH